MRTTSTDLLARYSKPVQANVCGLNAIQGNVCGLSAEPVPLRKNHMWKTTCESHVIHM